MISNPFLRVVCFSAASTLINKLTVLMLISGGITWQVEHLHCLEKHPLAFLFPVDPIIKCFSPYGDGTSVCY